MKLHFGRKLSGSIFAFWTFSQYSARSWNLQQDSAAVP
jgi:hypothetical protein